ncbi:MAG TPA: hypothetical protein PK079_20005 [Leptospiraceae bacterium]|nr:hypothetical protein [Leptospiraceae bacterium]HMW08275.1 hypothetical protein [Leptospiraceae bacterium]HMX35142.1 hypothetical protein [Leptospiraceae bacterium]HMY34041.1 hypothetical protein [Leptospiraceae bacterium]HMZ67154.1 hypothetical protein [Leptospiraceae bacterium]
MRAIETLINVKENGEIFLHFPQELKIGIHKIVIVLEDEIVNVENKIEKEYPISLEIDNAFKEELDKRSERMKVDPHPGYSWDETISYLEEKVGRKIQIRKGS